MQPVLEAPLYRPSASYQAPAPVAHEMSTANTSISELMAIPAIKAMLEHAIPGLSGRFAVEQLKPHLGNLSFRSLVQFGMFDSATLDRVDGELRAMRASGAIR
jgi:hypothetical protein